jgi:MoaA/NifB/PqqE/SkfB family radical SAM enzyme
MKSYADWTTSFRFPHPGASSKLFVETTSRCNLNCAMCMKQNDTVPPAMVIWSRHLTGAGSAFHPEALVLNGVGELLNSRLSSSRPHEN